MKKIISMLIAVVMIASLFTVIAIPTAAAETTYASLYTGEIDISWWGEFDEKTQLPVAKNPDATEYHITTADQLAGLSELVGFYFIDFMGVTIYLDTDIVWNTGVFSMDANGNPLYNGTAIDTTDYECHKAGDEELKFWTPIGDRDQAPGNTPSASGQFYGSFDGQGHTISGLYTNDLTLAYSGLFVVFCGKELKNVSIVNSYLGAESRSGSFAGFVYNPYECGDNRDIVGSRLSNLYSDAYVVSACGTSANNARSGGIVGMMRPRKIVDGQDPVAKGTVSIIENCWFNGTLAFYDSNVRYSGGIMGVAAIDSATNGEPVNEVIIQNTLMTGSFINYGLADTQLTAGPRAEGCRIGSVLGNIYKGKATLKNVIAVIKDTNITAENGYAGTVTNTETNETTPLGGKAPVGTLENDPSEVVYENVFLKAKGLFADATSTITIVEAERDHVGITGEYTTDSNLALALVALGGTDSVFDLSDLQAPAIKGLKLTCDPVNPADLNPEPPVTEPPVVDTDPPVVDTDPPVVDTDPPAGGDDPAVTTPTKPAVTTPTTQPVEEKGCGGFTAFAAVLALVAVSAVVVIKKK